METVEKATVLYVSDISNILTNIIVTDIIIATTSSISRTNFITITITITNIS